VDIWATSPLGGIILASMNTGDAIPRVGASAEGRYRADTLLDLYRAVWRVTGRQQLTLIGLSVIVAALAAAPLKFQQLVVNRLVEGADIGRVAWLCAGLLAVALLGSGLKFVLNLRLSVLGERIVLLVRERLYALYVGNASLRAMGTAKRGTLVTMLAAEAEAIGSFAGSAIASPLMQIGTLISVIGFILASQPWLGVLALGIVLPQAGIVVAMQRRLNQRVRERVQSLRDASDRISASDLARVEEEVVADFREVFETARSIYLLKLSSKLALNVISVTGAVGLLFLGGWLVLRGRSDVGTVMASLTGLTRIEGPWRELVAFFRQASTVRVRYAMLVSAIASTDGRVEATGPR
jgi:ABC-type bacteriocin/lantibiotic exporter with double-glycine peptidase domain